MTSETRIAMLEERLMLCMEEINTLRQRVQYLEMRMVSPVQPQSVPFTSPYPPMPVTCGGSTC